jgi:hypothetical protein
MTVRNLDFLFRPLRRHRRRRQPARLLCRRGGAQPRRRRLQGADPACAGEEAFAVRHRRPHPHFRAGVVPDLAIVCAPLRDMPEIVGELGERGTRAVMIGPSLHEKLTEQQVIEARKAILDAARPRLVRVLGPGSGGLVVPLRPQCQCGPGDGKARPRRAGGAVGGHRGGGAGSCGGQGHRLFGGGAPGRGARHRPGRRARLAGRGPGDRGHPGAVRNRAGRRASSCRRRARRRATSRWWRCAARASTPGQGPALPR